MDPITTAVVAALPTLASDLVKSSVKDAYDALKTAIRRRWGETSPVASAVDAFEGDPGSSEHAQSLAQKIAETKATEDPEVMKALAKLAASLAKPDIAGSATTEINLNIRGGNLQGVIGAQHVTVATLSFGATHDN
jgi:disulfide oxidoreductase YuzD